MAATLKDSLMVTSGQALTMTAGSAKVLAKNVSLALLADRNRAPRAEGMFRLVRREERNESSALRVWAVDSAVDRHLELEGLLVKSRPVCII